MGWVARKPHADVARGEKRIRALCGDDFIIGLSVSDEPDYSVMLNRAELAEIVALHDSEGLIDYVTCGSAAAISISTS